MAIRLAGSADHNWTSSSWLNAEAGATSQQETNTASTTTTTSYVYSAAFTVTNADVIDGVYLSVAQATATGTFTVVLTPDGGTTNTTTCTINTVDLPTAQSWCFFKFNAALTGNGTSNYKIGVKSSSSASVTVYRNSTGGNWARLLRTGATASLSTSGADTVYMAGTYTDGGSGTPATRTVTMDDNTGSSNSYGALIIGNGGLLTHPTGASSYIKISATLGAVIWSGGEWRVGKSGSAIGSGHVATLQFSGANATFTVNDGGTFTSYGPTVTNISAKLNADASAGASTLTTDISTGWSDQDNIAIGTTTTTVTQGEIKTLTGAASGTTVTLGTTLANAHSGTSPTQATIVHLTRGALITGSWVFSATAASTVNCFYTEFTSSVNGAVMTSKTSTGTFSLNYCSFHEFNGTNAVGLTFNNATANNGITVDHCVFYKSTSSMVSYSVGPTGSGTHTWTNNVLIVNAAQTCFNMGTLMAPSPGSTTLTFTGNTIIGTSNGVSFSSFTQGSYTLTYSNNVAVSCSTVGHGFPTNLSTVPAGSSISGCTAWRCAIGLQINPHNVTISTFTAFGNTTCDIDFAGGNNAGCWGAILDGCTLDGGSGTVGPIGVRFSQSLTTRARMLNTTIGKNSAHGTSELGWNDTIGGRYYEVVANDSYIAAPDQTQLVNGSYVSFQGFNQTTGDHRTYTQYGINKLDTVIYKTASPSERITLSGNTAKTVSGSKFVAINSGSTATVSVWVRRSVSTDAGGVNYNGNAPRLRVKRNDLAGYSADTTLATSTGSNGTWEQLSGTTASVSDDCILEFYVDCDGTSNCWLSVDDWTTS